MSGSKWSELRKRDKPTANTYRTLTQSVISRKQTRSSGAASAAVIAAARLAVEPPATAISQATVVPSNFVDVAVAACHTAKEQSNKLMRAAMVV